MIAPIVLAAALTASPAASDAYALVTLEAGTIERTALTDRLHTRRSG